MKIPGFGAKCLIFRSADSEGLVLFQASTLRALNVLSSDLGGGTFGACYKGMVSSPFSGSALLMDQVAPLFSGL